MESRALVSTQYFHINREEAEQKLSQCQRGTWMFRYGIEEGYGLSYVKDNTRQIFHRTLNIFNAEQMEGNSSRFCQQYALRWHQHWGPREEVFHLFLTKMDQILLRWELADWQLCRQLQNIVRYVTANYTFLYDNCINHPGAIQKADQKLIGLIKRVNRRTLLSPKSKVHRPRCYSKLIKIEQRLQNFLKAFQKLQTHLAKRVLNLEDNIQLIPDIVSHIHFFMLARDFTTAPTVKVFYNQKEQTSLHQLFAAAMSLSWRPLETVKELNWQDKIGICRYLSRFAMTPSLPSNHSLLAYCKSLQAIKIYHAKELDMVPSQESLQEVQLTIPRFVILPLCLEKINALPNLKKLVIKIEQPLINNTYVIKTIKSASLQEFRLCRKETKRIYDDCLTFLIQENPRLHTLALSKNIVLTANQKQILESSSIRYEAGL